jgi:hypothetical protein
MPPLPRPAPHRVPSPAAAPSSPYHCGCCPFRRRLSVAILAVRNVLSPSRRASCCLLGAVVPLPVQGCRRCSAGFSSMPLYPPRAWRILSVISWQNCSSWGCVRAVVGEEPAGKVESLQTTSTPDAESTAPCPPTLQRETIPAHAGRCPPPGALARSAGGTRGRARTGPGGGGVGPAPGVRRRITAAVTAAVAVLVCLAPAVEGCPAPASCPTAYRPPRRRRDAAPGAVVRPGGAVGPTPPSGTHRISP